MDIIIKSKAKSLTDRYGLKKFKLHPHVRIRLQNQIEQAITSAIKLDNRLELIRMERASRAGVQTKIEEGQIFVPKKETRAEVVRVLMN